MRKVHIRTHTQPEIVFRRERNKWRLLEMVWGELEGKIKTPEILINVIALFWSIPIHCFRGGGTRAIESLRSSPKESGNKGVLRSLSGGGS